MNLEGERGIRRPGGHHAGGSIVKPVDVLRRDRHAASGAQRQSGERGDRPRLPVEQRLAGEGNRYGGHQGDCGDIDGIQKGGGPLIFSQARDQGIQYQYKNERG